MIRETIESQNFRFLQFRHIDVSSKNPLMGALSPSLGARMRLQSPRQQYRAFRGWVVETIPDQIADLQPILEDWHPDVVITEASMLAPIMVLAEASAVPVAVASQFMGPLIPGPDAPVGFGFAPARSRPGRVVADTVRGATDLVASGLRRRVDEIRSAYGLPPLGCSLLAYTGRVPLYLVGSLPELDYRRRDLPASVHYVGPYLWHSPAQADAGWLDSLPTDLPWVHVSEGTSHSREPFVLRAAAQGLAERSMEVVMATGPLRTPNQLGLEPLAPNIHLTQWLDYDELLPRCAVIVTTGGTGTVLAALQAGVPMVVVPTSWDQPDNARRVVEAGAGVRLAARRCTPQRLRAAVEQVLDDESYRRNAQRLGRRLNEANGADSAAELLESLATGRLTVA